MDSDINFTDVVLETLPFADELKSWCKLHPEFYSALKVIYAERFIHLGGIVTSFSPNYPQDEVIGLIAYDYQAKTPIFKQDFIVNKRKEYKEFMLYTRNPGGSSQWVKDINEFYTRYGKGGYYANSHHLSFDELPDEEFKERGRRAIEIAKSFVGGKFIRPTQEKINDLYSLIIEEKKKTWVLKRKLVNSS